MSRCPKFSNESEFCISFGNESPEIRKESGEVQNPECLKSGVKCPQSAVIWGPCYRLVLAVVVPLCLIKPKVNAAMYQEVLGHFMLFAFYGGANFPSQQDSVPNSSAKTAATCFTGHVITVCDWPDNLPDCTPLRGSVEYFQEENEKHLT